MIGFPRYYPHSNPNLSRQIDRCIAAHRTQKEREFEDKLTSYFNTGEPTTAGFRVYLVTSEPSRRVVPTCMEIRRALRHILETRPDRLKPWLTMLMTKHGGTRSHVNRAIEEITALRSNLAAQILEQVIPKAVPVVEIGDTIEYTAKGHVIATHTDGYEVTYGGVQASVGKDVVTKIIPAEKRKPKPGDPVRYNGFFGEVRLVAHDPTSGKASVLHLGRYFEVNYDELEVAQ